MPIHQAGIRDGGPFIGSGLMITKNPQTGQRNLSFHRLQMKGPKKTGILLYPRHAWTNYQMYEAQDKPMPVAIMIGHHPMYYFAARDHDPIRRGRAGDRLGAAAGEMSSW